MNANDLIESYVTEVAEALPRKQRNDVAFELRALLREELEGKAEEAGRLADATMALELLQAFGRPADVAARYRPTLTIIDPADGQTFLRATVIGLVVIWSIGLLVCLQQPIDSGGDLLGVLGQWWVSTVLSSLWWPGVLVVSFGLAARARRRRPQSSVWKPPASEPSQGSRAAMALGLVGIACGLFVLLDPRWVLDAFFGGRAAPAAYEALTYTETFRQRQGLCLLVLLLLNIPMILTVMVKGRSAGLRRLELGLNLTLCAVLVWTMLDGPVFVASGGDRAVKSCLSLIVAYILINIGLRARRSVRPAPNQQIRA